ncbi:MAG: endonuclease domain-containing protein [Aestuariivirga sp.]
MTANRLSATGQARELLREATPAERRLWAILRNRQLGGYKFTRQYPIGPYFADFACRQRNLVIEVDGSAHPDHAGHDRARDEYMMRAGYSVFRVAAISVLKDRGGVCNSLLAVLENRIEDFADAPDAPLARSTEMRASVHR